MCVVYFTKNAIFDDFMALESLLNHVVDPKPIDIKNNRRNKNKYNIDFKCVIADEKILSGYSIYNHVEIYKKN